MKYTFYGASILCAAAIYPMYLKYGWFGFWIAVIGAGINTFLFVWDDKYGGYGGVEKP